MDGCASAIFWSNDLFCGVMNGETFEYGLFRWSTVCGPRLAKGGVNLESTLSMCSSRFSSASNRAVTGSISLEKACESIG